MKPINELELELELEKKKAITEAIIHFDIRANLFHIQKLERELKELQAVRIRLAKIFPAEGERSVHLNSILELLSQSESGIVDKLETAKKFISAPYFSRKKAHGGKHSEDPFNAFLYELARLVVKKTPRNKEAPDWAKIHRYLNDPFFKEIIPSSALAPFLDQAFGKKDPEGNSKPSLSQSKKNSLRQRVLRWESTCKDNGIPVLLTGVDRKRS